MSEPEKADLIERFASAKHPDRPVTRTRPPGVNDAVVGAVGKLSEALEAVEHARGHLYAFHRLSGTADRLLQEAVAALEEAGEAALAGQVAEVLVGRDVVADMWTFQIVDVYDEQYWSVFRAVEDHVRQQLVGGVRHVFEAEMKHREQA